MVPKFVRCVSDVCPMCYIGHARELKLINTVKQSDLGKRKVRTGSKIVFEESEVD